MQAVVKTSPVDGASGTEIRDCPVPKPGPDEVLIRVAAAAICGTDKHIYHWDPSIREGFKPPRIYGHEFCGFIESFGERAQRSKPHGDGPLHAILRICTSSTSAPPSPRK